MVMRSLRGLLESRESSETESDRGVRGEFSQLTLCVSGSALKYGCRIQQYGGWCLKGWPGHSSGGGITSTVSSKH